MKKAFLPSLFLLALVLCVSATSYAQTDTTAKTDPNAKSTDNTAKAVAPVGKDGTPAIAITATTSPVDLARAALAAHGGEKYKTLKNMILRGSANLYAPNSTQSLPGGFVLVIAGEKLLLEVDARPMFNLKQIFDGQRSYSSIPNFEMPAASKFGLPVLAKFDQPGYTVSALPDKKKQRAFRIVDSEGNTTDFYLDTATGRVTTCLIPYNGYTFGIENSKFKEIDGVQVPFEFTWRLETQQGAYFAEYKVKDAKLNQPLGDDVFAMPN
jgi:hypothetical protein